MIRRDFLKLTGAALVSFIVPAPRRIDLKAFCAKHEMPLYDMRLPYEVNDWTYATNGFNCLRVRPESGDSIDHKGKMPPFDELSWNHARLGCWRSLPQLDPIMASRSDCPVCEGYGHLPCDKHSYECEECWGTGMTFVGTDYHISRRVNCTACQGRGWLRPMGTTVCHHCHGNAIGNFPALVNLHGRYFNVRHYEKVRSLNAEFVLDCYKGMASHPLLKYRFDGGEGQLMAFDTIGAEQQIKEAAHA